MSSSVISHRSRQRGFSLIEVLVAMLILAIGLLGLAALQTQGMRFNHDAYVRTSATTLAVDIIDKMRLTRNSTTVSAASFITANFPDRNALPAGGYTVESPPYNCTGANAQFGSVDSALACWLNGVELGLPLGRATIARQAAPNDEIYDINIMWLDREPRTFGGTSRLPNTKAECEAIASRLWVAPPGKCFVTQTWTVWP